MVYVSKHPLLCGSMKIEQQCTIILVVTFQMVFLTWLCMWVIQSISCSYALLLASVGSESCLLRHRLSRPFAFLKCLPEIFLKGLFCFKYYLHFNMLTYCIFEILNRSKMSTTSWCIIYFHWSGYSWDFFWKFQQCYSDHFFKNFKNLKYNTRM